MEDDVHNSFNHFEYVVMSFGLAMHMLSFNIWWMMFSVRIWMILLFVTLMTFSFYWKTWQTMSAMYVLFWKNFEKLVFMSNWNNMDSINLRWNSWVILFLEMAFAGTFVRFKTFWIGLTQLLFGMFYVFLGSPISINNSLHIIPWQWPLLLIWLRRINLFPKELKLKRPFNVWRLPSWLPHYWFMQTLPNLLFWRWTPLTLH
jgi:hypothetical protein